MQITTAGPWGAWASVVHCESWHARPFFVVAYMS